MEIHKSMKEENNFAHVLKYLRNQGMIRNQKELAERLNTTETTITRNKKGYVKHPDEKTIESFDNAFGDIINIAYLRGDSDVMLVADLQPKSEFDTNVNTCKKRGCPADCANLIHATLAAKDDAIMALKHEIVTKDALISHLQKQVLELQALCAMK